MIDKEKEHYENVIYPEIARKDFERELYKQIDREDDISDEEKRENYFAEIQNEREEKEWQNSQ